MNEIYANTNKKNYAKIGSNGDIGATIKDNPLFSEYKRFMEKGRYSKALEIAVELRSRYHIGEVEKTAKEFYLKHPTLSEARDYSDVKKQLIKQIKEKKDNYLDDILFEE